ncbi:MAG: hypothetical protein D6738_13950 [Acidobacteria bacterium]|nr:MAG: hypothetical protein D6738_13950 [Acidobacteriota bacterium]
MAEKLGELLIREGLIAADQLEEALRSQRIFGGSLGSHLLQLGYVDEDALGRALGRVYGVPVASRAELIAAPPEVVALLPPEFSRRHRALPFKLEGHRLHLALQNPADSLAVHEASFLTGFQIVPHVSPEAVLRDSIAYHRRGEPAAATPAARPPRREAPPATTRAEPAAPARPRPEHQTGPVRITNPVLTGDPPVGLATGPVAIPASAERARRHSPALAALGRALASARNRDELLGVLLEEMTHHASRALVLLVRQGQAVVWKGEGFGTVRRRPALPLDAPSVLDPVREERALSFGPVAMTPANRDFYTLLGGRPPAVALVLPIYVRRRPLVVLYGDETRADSRPPDFARLRAVSRLAAWALEALILRAKILRESGADEGDGEK